jgi:hypothetical protein
MQHFALINDKLYSLIKALCYMFVPRSGRARAHTQTLQCQVFLDADSGSASQDIPHFSCLQKVYYYIHNSPTLDFVYRQCFELYTMASP